VDSISCYGANDGKVVLSVTPAGQYSYTWSNGGNSNVDSITGLAPGTYSVVATNPDGCSAAAGPFTLLTPALDSIITTPSDTSITLGDTVQLNSALSGTYTGISYAWTAVSPATTSGFSCTNCPTPTVVPKDTLSDVYTLAVTYGNGCTASAYDTIKATANDLIAIPTGFTPNGDGKNDTFVILATGVKSFSMNIYNRWGEMVFSTSNINEGWDGTYKGKPQPEEPYSFFFSITYLDGKSQNREGSIMLLR
jgi:gliding motility-associated-like protein